MDTAADGSFCPFKFNFKLFIVEEKPLKFYLDGYENAIRDFIGITKIIEAFGGNIADSPGTDVIILSGCSKSNLLSEQRYDVKFLHDSIATGKLQDLVNYRITLDHQKVVSPVVEKQPTSLCSEMKKDVSSDKIKNDIDVDISLDNKMLDGNMKSEDTAVNKSEKPLETRSNCAKKLRLLNETLVERFKEVRVMIHRLETPIFKNNSPNGREKRDNSTVHAGENEGHEEKADKKKGSRKSVKTAKIDATHELEESAQGNSEDKSEKESIQFKTPQLRKRKKLDSAENSYCEEMEGTYKGFVENEFKTFYDDIEEDMLSAFKFLKQSSPRCEFMTDDD